MAAKDRITPIKKVRPAVESLQVPSMVVRVAAPSITVPTPKMNVVVDSNEFARALDTMSKHISQLTATLADTAARAEQRMEKMMEEHRKMAQKMSQTKPTVNIPPRPSSFYVELEKDGKDTIGMRIEADPSVSDSDSSED